MFSLLLLVALAASPSTDPVKAALYAAPSFEPLFLGDARPKAKVKLKRIVTVAPSVTEIIFALGAGDRVVGVSRYDDFPERVKTLARVGGFLDPNIEAILALEPDLVAG